MRKKIIKYSKSRRLMAFLAAFLFAFDLVITMMARSGNWFVANAAVEASSLASMRARAEEIINYTWIPSRDIKTWNGNKYNGSSVFKKGQPVKGMPFCLFTTEVVDDYSLKSLREYKNYAKSNYSATAKCNSVSGQWRTGPVYGSCCANFVSEVLGGSFMRGTSPRYGSVTKIVSSPYASHYSKVKANKIQIGDAISKNGHVAWVGDITDKYFVIYEQTPPVSRKVVVERTSVDSNGYLIFKGSVYNVVTRINVTSKKMDLVAPVASTAHQYYAENAQVDVNWKYVTNASYYLVDVFKDGDPIVSGEVVIDTNYQVNNGNGDYEVYVTSVCGSQQLKSECVSFSIGKLDAPVFTTEEVCYPSGNEVKIDWKPSAGATNYHVTVTKNDDEPYCEADVNDTSFSLSPEDGYYELDVEAINEIGGLQKAKSEKYWFFVGNKRLIAIDSSVKYFAHDGEVALRWNDCEGVSDYNLKVSGDKEDSFDFSETVSGRTSFALNGLPDGRYTAVVSAVESTGEYDWIPSKVLEFYVGVLDQPVVTSESKYYDIDSKATVNWDSCKGATGYHIVVKSDDTAVYEDDLNGTSCTFDTEEGKYTVTVTAVNTNGGRQECVSDEFSVWAVSLDMDKVSQTLHPGENAKLNVAVSTADPQDSLKWTSSNAEIATVDSDGTVTAVGLGTATVKASLGDISVSSTIEVVPDLSYEILGASIRLTEPYGIRFGLRIEKDEAYKSTKIVEYGTLMIAVGTLGDQELTMETANCLCIKANNDLENTSGHITYTGVLINIPESFFNTNVVGRGYLKYEGADGEVYTMYSNTVVKSFNGVAQAAYENYSKIEEPTAAQQKAINNLKDILGIKDEPADETTESQEATESQEPTESEEQAESQEPTESKEQTESQEPTESQE